MKIRLIVFMAFFILVSDVFSTEHKVLRGVGGNFAIWGHEESNLSYIIFFSGDEEPGEVSYSKDKREVYWREDLVWSKSWKGEQYFAVVIGESITEGKTGFTLGDFKRWFSEKKRDDAKLGMCASFMKWHLLLNRELKFETQENLN